MIKLDDFPLREHRQVRFDDAQADENLDEPRLIPTAEPSGCKREAKALDLVARHGGIRRWKTVRECLGLSWHNRNELKTYIVPLSLPSGIASLENAPRPISIA